MDTVDLIKKVRKIEIYTRGLSKNIFSGGYHSAFKGRGMAFAEVREYMPGDDVRTIDWNVTARYNHPYVKVFEEERELTVMLLVDVSGSQDFGTNTQNKRELLTELSAVLSFSAISNNDKIGVIFFSDKIEKFIPPKKGKTHTLRIIRELIEFKPESKGTDVALALEYMTNVIKKKSIVFLLSDFVSKDFSKSLKIASRKHDTIAVRLYDPKEAEIPDLGLVHIRDAETGKISWADTSSKEFRNHYKNMWVEREQKLDKLFAVSNVDEIKIHTGQPYIVPLKTFFKMRGMRR